MISLGAIILPEDLVWVDEYAWHPPIASEKRTLSGKLIVQAATRLGGRPITLDSNGKVWLTKAQVDALLTLNANNPSAYHTLVFHDRTFSVYFKNSENSINATPIYPVSDPDPGFFYFINIKLLEK